MEGRYAADSGKLKVRRQVWMSVCGMSGVQTVARTCEQQLVLCGRTVLVRHKLGEFVGRTWVWAVSALTHPEESLLLPFLHVQLLFKGLEEPDVWLDYT